MVSISMKQLLEAGVHFGHQTKRWNPKMKDYIFGQRNGIYIIDLQKSLKLFKSAIQFTYDLGAQGKTLLFLGTKRQAQEAIQEAAGRTSMFYVNQRWLGGLLTNFMTIQKSLKRFRELETMKDSGQYDLFSKKEVARYERERKKLEKNLSGIKDMGTLPDALFVVDTNMESIAIKEAVKLGIPVIGVADTNCNPDGIDYIIPGNDDALRSIRLVTDTIAQAYIDGKAMYEARQKELAEQREKERQLQAQQAAAAREAAAVKNTETVETGTLDAAPATEGEAAKPRTTVRKTLQRKPKVKKPETVSEAASVNAAAKTPEEVVVEAPAALTETAPPDVVNVVNAADVATEARDAVAAEAPAALTETAN